MQTRATLLVAILGMFFLSGMSADEGYTPLAELREGFEPPPEGSTNGPTPSWTVVTGNATVTSETSYAGNYSLRIEATDPAGQVAFNLPTNGNNSVTFVDFRLLPIAPISEEADNTIDVAGAQAGFLRVNSQGNLCAFDASGNGTWRDTGAKWTTLGDGTINQWVRLTMRLVPALHKWDLYADGKMVLADLGLISSAQDKLVLFGDLHSPIYVDELYAGAVNPLFVDLNSDGLPDGWVAARTGGASIDGSPRDWEDENFGGVNLLTEYLSTVATLSIPGELDSHKFVFVHPTISSWGELASLLKLLNTAVSRDPEEKAYMDGLARDLEHIRDAALAGLPAPSAWHIAVDTASAIQQAEDGSEIVLFPFTGPYVSTAFDPQGKQLRMRALEGVVFSTPETVSEALIIQAQKQADLQAALTLQGGASNAAALEQLWPAVQAADANVSAQHE